MNSLERYPSRTAIKHQDLIGTSPGRSGRHWHRVSHATSQENLARLVPRQASAILVSPRLIGLAKMVVSSKCCSSTASPSYHV